MNKGQASVEFTIMVIFAILFLAVVASAFFEQMQIVEQQLFEKQLSLFAGRIAKTINFAARTDGFFYTAFDLAGTITGEDYGWVYEQGGDYLIINTSGGERLIFFNANVTFFLGDSSSYCVTGSGGNVSFANRVVGVQDGKLYLGCMSNLTRAVLRFSNLSSFSADVGYPWNLLGLNVSRSGLLVNVTASGASGTFPVASVDGVVEEVMEIDAHMGLVGVKS